MVLLAVFPLPTFCLRLDISCLKQKNDEMEEEKETRKLGCSFAENPRNFYCIIRLLFLNFFFSLDLESVSLARPVA